MAPPRKQAETEKTNLILSQENNLTDQVEITNSKPFRVRFSQPLGSVMTGRRKPNGKISKYDEVKGVALNLKHSSENRIFWDRADPIVLGASHAVSTPKTSAKPTPTVTRMNLYLEKLC